MLNSENTDSGNVVCCSSCLRLYEENNEKIVYS